MQPRALKSRRQFIRDTSLSGLALVLGAYLPGCNTGSAPNIINASGGTLPTSIELMTWISIDRSGKVSILTHRAEMGQGAYTVVPQMIAEELEVDLKAINIVFAPGNQKKYGSQVTGGSSTVRGSYKHLLRIGASAREMLTEAAAKKWNVNQADCYAENGSIIHKPTGKAFTYGDLVADAAKLQPPKEPKLKARSEYRLVGKPLPRKDTPLKTNGAAIFGIDKKIPGMLYAVVERSPRIRGKVKSFDDTQTKTIPGVRHVITVQRTVFDHLQEGVAVVADNLWAAMQGRQLLKVDWDDSGFEHLSSEQLFARMHEDLKKSGLNDRTSGDFERAFQKATTKVEAVYEAPYEAHACMEPLNCIADVKDDSITIWGPIQGPDWVQSDLSQRMGVPLDKVTVNMTFLGGGFGRKAFLDYPHEAAVISKAIKAPVQVVWTREDDMTQGPFRPGAVYACKAGLSKEGRVEAFHTTTATQNMNHENPGVDPHSFNDSTTEGLCKPYFDSFTNYSFADIPTVSPIPVMWWRSVYASTNGFAYESFIDELAHAAGKDPLEFRRQHLDDDRYQALIDQLITLSGWKDRGKNQGWGVAITECFSSIVGEVVKVSRKPDGKIKVDKVIALMDCGWYVNPDIIRQQVEGSIVMALGAATKHDIHFKDGMAVEKNFDTYSMPRIHEIPEIEVHVVDNDERAGGVGEPGLPPLAPALCNAIFDLTNKRIRRLPFNLDEV
ncbi:xanthine dehydrogenase family protein molybdopterin-binding subunit [Puia dinghuensis]|uniref:Oxidoreductase n=1 Tax=Puia dinghuensis TaxID=1792502 RepID=A0A8J2XVK7_9BACT|nr:molybdopterin cofactor-binding domain-containing protein [Puia dinghuensis]GGB17229.1 oxidoreductase [Puia dinghuensis]